MSHMLFICSPVMVVLGSQQQSIHDALHRSHAVPAQLVGRSRIRKPSWKLATAIETSASGRPAQKRKRTDTITSKTMASKTSRPTKRPGRSFLSSDVSDNDDHQLPPQSEGQNNLQIMCIVTRHCEQKRVPHQLGQLQQWIPMMKMVKQEQKEMSKQSIVRFRRSGGLTQR